MHRLFCWFCHEVAHFICVIEDCQNGRTWSFLTFRLKEIFLSLQSINCFHLRNNHSYRNDPKYSDRYAWANSVDPDQTAPRGAEEQSDQSLHCLPFSQHHLAASFCIIQILG